MKRKEFISKIALVMVCAPLLVEAIMPKDRLSEAIKIIIKECRIRAINNPNINTDLRNFINVEIKKLLDENGVPPCPRYVQFMNDSGELRTVRFA